VLSPLAYLEDILRRGDTNVAYQPWAFMCLGIIGTEWQLLALDKAHIFAMAFAVMSIEHSKFGTFRSQLRLRSHDPRKVNPSPVF
jgi:hypothetical protein